MKTLAVVSSYRSGPSLHCAWPAGQKLQVGRPRATATMTADIIIIMAYDAQRVPAALDERAFYRPAPATPSRIISRPAPGRAGAISVVDVVFVSAQSLAPASTPPRPSRPQSVAPVFEMTNRYLAAAAQFTDCLPPTRVCLSGSVWTALFISLVAVVVVVSCSSAYIGFSRAEKRRVAAPAGNQPRTRATSCKRPTKQVGNNNRDDRKRNNAGPSPGASGGSSFAPLEPNRATDRRPIESAPDAGRVLCCVHGTRIAPANQPMANYFIARECKTEARR
jgi:hypothetical protein